MAILHGVQAEARQLGFSWYGKDLPVQAWRFAIPVEVLSELDERLRSTARTSPGNGSFAAPPAELARTAAFMSEVRARLQAGPGVVVASTLPVADWGHERTCQVVGWMGPLLAPMMYQSRDETIIYDVRDTGATQRPGVRRSITNAPQPFHTDGPWPRSPANFIGLHCIEPATTGGVSRCISLDALLDDLEAVAPRHYERLSRDLPWHRQGEHAKEQSPVSFWPLWWREGGVRQVRLYTDYVHSGARALGPALDAPAVQSLANLEELCIDPNRWLEFVLQRGEVLWVNNRRLAHSRTGFAAGAGTRHLLRTWHRFGSNPCLDA